MPVAPVSSRVRARISPRLLRLHVTTNASSVNKSPGKKEDKTINGFSAQAATLAGAILFPITPPFRQPPCSRPHSRPRTDGKGLDTEAGVSLLLCNANTSWPLSTYPSHHPSTGWCCPLGKDERVGRPESPEQGRGRGAP